MVQTDAVTEEKFTVEREIRIDAPPETVFEFFTDPQKMTLWSGAEAELDPVPGGIYRVCLSPQAIALGEYVRIEPPREVVYTWGWEGEGPPVPPGSSTVHVTLIPDGDGTIVRLRHTGLPTEEMAREHARGWEHYLARLSTAAAGGDPGPDVFAEGGE